MNFILRGNWKTLFFIKVYHYPKVISSSMFLLSLRQVIWQKSFGEVGGREWGSTSSLPDLNNFNFALNRKTCLFWCYALNYRPGEFLVSSFLCRKTVPQHNIWLKKVVQLATQGFKQSIQRRRLTTTSKYTYKLVWPDVIVNLGFPLSHFSVRSPRDFKFSRRILPYNHEQVAGLPPPLRAKHQKGKRSLIFQFT